MISWLINTNSDSSGINLLFDRRVVPFYFRDKKKVLASCVHVFRYTLCNPE